MILGLCVWNLLDQAQLYLGRLTQFTPDRKYFSILGVNDFFGHWMLKMSSKSNKIVTYPSRVRVANGHWSILHALQTLLDKRACVLYANTRQVAFMARRIRCRLSDSIQAPAGLLAQTSGEIFMRQPRETPSGTRHVPSYFRHAVTRRDSLDAHSESDQPQCLDEFRVLLPLNT